MTNESDIADASKSVYSTIASNIQISLRKDSVSIIDSVVDHTINISKSKIVSGGNYIKLPTEFDHPKDVSINLYNINDKKCFKWCLVRYISSRS